MMQDVQRVFRIPHKVILDMLLANLSLNSAQYERAIHDDKIRVIVSFNTAARILEDQLLMCLCLESIA